MPPPTCVHTAEHLLHWLALRLTPGLGARKTTLLLERFGSPEAIFRASPTELEAAGLPGSAARSLASGCAFEDAAEQQERLKATGTQVVTFTDANYPPQLRQIYDPPPLLFAQGRVELLETVMVAMVGSRRPSTYGVVAAEHLAIDLAKAGVTVSSGMAKGIDTAAHLGALNAGGGTCAVFGCGLDIIYPAENRKLAARIAAEGLLLSEFPLGTPAHPQNFPIRNRIVSGLSDGVVVVEGVQYSGSLITARLALDQNKEVFAVPGNITSKLSFGPNLLLKQGAQLVQSAADILDGLSWETRSKLARQAELPLEEPAGQDPGPMAGIASQVLSLLKVDTPLHLDSLLEHLLDCSPSEVIATLFELELRGQVRQLPGRSYVKVWYE
ncbi:MAG: DNA-processing protein DprA [Acidobacteria bacterium]|nr:DNA-processing protein DprA [Acidobacteriota bacterium]